MGARKAALILMKHSHFLIDNTVEFRVEYSVNRNATIYSKFGRKQKKLCGVKGYRSSEKDCIQLLNQAFCSTQHFAGNYNLLFSSQGNLWIFSTLSKWYRSRTTISKKNWQKSNFLQAQPPPNFNPRRVCGMAYYIFQPKK